MSAESNASQLRQLVYVSSATAPFSAEDLRVLLAEARAKNEERGITGMLLYHDGNFIQAIEGEAAAVETLHAEILRDPRHRGVLVLSRGPIERRQFDGWAMGFVDTSALTNEERAAHTSYLADASSPRSFEQQPTRAMKLLETFRKTVRR